jgi:uncharacterized membrane protein
MGSLKKGNKKNRYIAILAFLVLGMLLSAILIWEHFSPTASEFCKFGEALDCGIVNKSPYANLDGFSYLLTIDFGLPIPLINISGINAFFDFITANAFLGFLTLLFLFFLVMAKNKGRDFLWIKSDSIRKWTVGILIFGVAYGFYLFLIQQFILETYCIFCLGLDIVLIISLVLAWRIR